MPPTSGPRAALLPGLAVALPTLLGAGLAGLIGVSVLVPEQRATGVVQLSEIAGDTSAGELNPIAADLESALASASVRKRILDELGTPQDLPVVEVLRLDSASRVSIALQADDAEQARVALLAAGRAGYTAIVEQQQQLLQVRERAAEGRLAELNASAAAARALAAAQGASADDVPAVQQSERLVSIALEDLSEVQGRLAVADELAAGAPETNAVAVEGVEPVSILARLLPIVAGGLAGGALSGALLAVLLRRRRRRATRHRGGSGRRSAADRQQTGLPVDALVAEHTGSAIARTQPEPEPEAREEATAPGEPSRWPAVPAAPAATEVDDTPDLVTRLGQRAVPSPPPPVETSAPARDLAPSASSPVEPRGSHPRAGGT